MDQKRTIDMTDIKPDENYAPYMTRISRSAFDKATIEIKSEKEAVQYLYDELIRRNTRSIIEKFSKGQDMEIIREKLIDGLMEHNPDKKIETVQRDVRYWLSPKGGHVIKKENAIEMSFILGLSLEEAEEFLALISKEKLHYREMKDLIYIYGLQNGLSYKECTEILQRPETQHILCKIHDYGRLTKIIKDEYIAFVKKEKKERKEFKTHFCQKYKEFGVIEAAEIQDILSEIEVDGQVKDIFRGEFTEFVEADFRKKNIKSVEELIQYFSDNYTYFGNFHNKAYDAFMKMLWKLKAPSEVIENLGIFEKADKKNKKADKKKNRASVDDMRERSTVRDLLLEYFYCLKWMEMENDDAKEDDVDKKKKKEKIKLYSSEKKSSFNAIQKVISDKWPDEETFSRMQSRRIDVTRKILILLFLATDGEYEENSIFMDAAPEEVFGEVLEGLNNMLFYCGYAALDPRNPFDWLIIYCIYVRDSYHISDKMQSVIEELFQKEEDLITEEKCMERGENEDEDQG